jgi:hypothetical protein
MGWSRRVVAEAAREELRTEEKEKADVGFTGPVWRRVCNETVNAMLRSCKIRGQRKGDR